MKNFVLLSCLVSLLTACGGGSSFEPVVSQIRVQSLRYGQSAVIDVAGKFLRNDMIADTGTCTNPTYRVDAIAAGLTATVNGLPNVPTTDVTTLAAIQTQ